jgi:SAM-dependent methyltransferase
MLEMKIPFSRSVQKLLVERQARGMLKDWCFSRTRINMLINEYKDMKANYLPIDVRGLTVLDVGAGEGETALLYLAYGAKKVICVEANPECFSNLVLNSKKHNIVPVLEPFNVEMLNEFDFDFMKCDIEGYEEMLLDVDLVKPAVIEVHGLQLRDKFAEKGYRIGKRILEKGNYWACSTSYAFWKCQV